MEQIMEVLMPAVISLLGTVISVVTGIIGYKISKWGDKYIENQNTLMTTEEKKAVITSTVDYVEQVFKDLNGAEKLEKAKERALTLLNEQGIEITDDQLETLIEAAVKGLKAGNEEAKKEG